ncbi:peptidyl-tRNA hydrolase [Mycoplasmopsis maculosa]|uniref:Peptidyl-tRNA hydrolase n=1 Tax=Mycoplasmopsis maculosa TaxID=114885 RepID=A0A449B515_9BACT|nr:aminoacyl-tRNA hydrolase [Mycoplasmopsis maculosa]VEU75618.1 peptidyl-tRNA hydrolase [Mycoplasmopsis maculosa]
MKLIVGLGNPGDHYRYTRHNAGFLAIDKICEKLGNIQLNKEKFNGKFAVIDDVIIAKPYTYMNLSGDFIYSLANFYKIDSSDIMIIFDEKDYEIGKAAIKIGGSSAGHNGVQSVINHFKDNDFKRLRIGIGNRGELELKDFVLSNFKPGEFQLLEKVLEKSAEAAISFIYNDINIVINSFNSNKKGVI